MAQSTTDKVRETAGRLKPGESELTPAAKTVAAAVTAALAGGLAAAAKAFVEHRGGNQDDPGPSEEQRDEPQQQEDEPDSRQEQEQPDEEEHEDDVPDSRQEQEQPGEEEQDDDAPAHDRREAAPAGGATRIIEAGRSELEQVLGQQVESISGFRRSDDEGWCVTYEVVEMRRIPDSSDVLSSYAVTLNDDAEVVGVERTHRYRRAQVDGQ